MFDEFAIVEIMSGEPVAGMLPFVGMDIEMGVTGMNSSGWTEIVLALSGFSLSAPRTASTDLTTSSRKVAAWSLDVKSFAEDPMTSRTKAETTP